MNKKNTENINFVYDAVAHLENIIDKPVRIKMNKGMDDGILTLDKNQFIIEAKSGIRSSNLGIVLNEIQKIKEKSIKPIIVITKYIATDIAKEFKKLGYNYIDISGNCYIKQHDLLIYITGQKVKKISKTNQSRAFQEAGIKLIFNLLQNPKSIQFSYRRLAELTGVSIGSVSNVMTELEELNFLFKTKDNRILKNKEKLLDRWIVAYNDVLRPRLIKKRMFFSKIGNFGNWDTLPIQDIDDVNLWGGEPAAALLTGKLQPVKFTIYTNGSWQNIARKFKLTPSDEGEIEILQMFWKEEDKYRNKPTVPEILVYAELISSGFDRNSEIAQTILENELQYIK